MQPQPISKLLTAATTTKTATDPAPLHKRVSRHSWHFEAYHPALAGVLSHVQRFCSDVLSNSRPYWITLLGPSGVGKTYILRQAYSLLNDGGDGWAIPIRDGMGSERRAECGYCVPAEDLTDYRSPRDWARLDCVYVEDIGSGAGLDKGSGSVLKSRIAELLQLRTGKWTMLDANLSRSEIAEKLDPRIASRLKRDGSVLIEIPASVSDYSEHHE